MKNNQGFTLIEVMVATAVLMIMALMMGSMFRQASSAWDSGYAKAEGGMIVRAVAGSLKRDLAGAVDGRRYGMSAPISGGGSLTFITLKEVTRSDGTIYREPHRITYTSGSTVTRKDEAMKEGSASWTTVGTSDLYSDSDGNSSRNGSSFSASVDFVLLGMPSSNSTNPGSSDSDRGDFGDTSVNDENESSLKWDVPAVKVRVKLSQSGSFSGLTIVSCGPDGVLAQNASGDEAADPDDIVVR